MRDGEVGRLSVAVETPVEPAVSRHDEIIDLYAEVGIESGFVIGEQVDGGHDEAYNPELDAGAIFEPEIKETDEGSENVENHETVVLVKLLKLCHRDVRWVIAAVAEAVVLLKFEREMGEKMKGSLNGIDGVGTVVVRLVACDAAFSVTSEGGAGSSEAFVLLAEDIVNGSSQSEALYSYYIIKGVGNVEMADGIGIEHEAYGLVVVAV